MKPVAFQYQSASTTADAARGLSEAEEVKLLAGGQTLGPMLNLRLARPERVIDISRIGDLRKVEAHDAFILFGAAVTHAEIEDGQHPDPLHGAMARVAHGIAYRVVRNRGTLGGSLAHADPSADWLSFMTALDAVIHVEGPAGHRTIGIGDFVVAPYTTQLEEGELIRAIQVPRHSRSARFGYHKLCRKVGEFADAIGAVLIAPDAGVCRVVSGAVSPKPVLLKDTAANVAAKAQLPALDDIRDELRGHVPDADGVSLQMGAVAVRRALEEAWHA